jgi:hypothetical protein
MRRIVIVIVAGLVFGVTAAYATTSHSNSGKAPSAHPAPAATFATQANPGGSTSTGGADDPVTHDQTDDQGQAGSSTSDTRGATGQSDDSQADDSRADESRADESQAGNSKGDDSQDGSGQGGGSQSGGGSDDSGGSGSGGDGGGD